MSQTATLKKSQVFDLSTQAKMATFSLARLTLLTIVLFTTIFLKQEVLGFMAILQIYIVLAISFFISLMNVSLWEQTLRVRHFIPSQLLYDMLFTSYLVYLTGVNDSIFLFLYMLNIVFSSVVYQLNGALLVAGVSGTIYALIYFVNVDLDVNANAIYNLAHSELLFLLTALLSGQFMDELKKQRKLLEEQRSSIARLELFNDRMVNSIPVGLVTVDENEYVQKINQAALSLLKLSHAPEMRIKYYELLPELKGILQAWEKMTETQKLRFLFRHSSGQPRFSLQLAKLRKSVKNEQEELHHVLVFQDVSKMIELEQKLEFESRLAATGQFAAAIAHEIRNPLASISGSIEMLAQHLQIENTQDKKLFDISLREIRRLNNLITEFLEYAKPRDEATDDFRLAEVIVEVSDAILSSAASGQKVTFKNSVGTNLMLHANRERFKQVLFNLFLNTIEAATPKDVEISMAASADSEGMVLIDLTDNGPGIPAHLVSKVFDPFFTTKPSGTGLGLSTVARIVKAAKGEIKVHPSNNGAHFQITIPASSKMDLAETAS